MSATGISAISLSQINPPFVVAGQGQQLKNSIQAGDLAGAQQAFNALSALHNGNGPFKNPTLASDFAAIGTALQAGDLAGAQQAAATLQRAINHHGGGGSANPDVILRISPAASAATSAPSAPSASAGSPAAPIASSVAPITSKGGSTSGSGAPTSTTPAAATATPEIVLNLNAGTAQQLDIRISNSSSGEQVNLSVGNGSSSAEQIQLNLAQNQALQINLIA
jgi:hypothetical protein